MKRLCLAVIASLLAVGSAAAQVPPNGSDQNDWMRDLAHELADATNNGPKLAISASAIGTTGVITATLAADPLKTNFICGFVMTAAAAEPIAGTGTVTGVQGGELGYDFANPSTGKDLIGVVFQKCISATGKNVAIVVTQPACPSCSTGAVTVWGYKQ